MVVVVVVAAHRHAVPAAWQPRHDLGGEHARRRVHRRRVDLGRKAPAVPRVAPTSLQSQLNLSRQTSARGNRTTRSGGWQLVSAQAKHSS